MKLTSFYEMLATLPGGVYVPVRFTSRKNQIGKGAVKRGRRFFVDRYPRRLEREKPWGRGCKGGTFFSVL